MPVGGCAVVALVVVVLAGAIWPVVVSAEATLDVALKLDPWVLDGDCGKLPNDDANGPGRPGIVAVPAEPGDASDELDAPSRAEPVGTELADGIAIVVAITVAAVELLRFRVIVIVRVPVSVRVLRIVVVESGDDLPLS
jgi:hypothetical protein